MLFSKTTNIKTCILKGSIKTYISFSLDKKRHIGGLVISSLSCTVLSDEPLRKKSTVIT